MVIINGEPGDGLSTLDRGLLYGDGVFETIAVKQGRPQYWERHLQRLRLGCKALRLPGADEAVLKDEVRRLIGGDGRCVIKVIVTRGAGGRGYKPPRSAQTRIIQKFPWPQFPSGYVTSGVDVTLCDFKLAHQPGLAGIKHLNRLEQVLARSEWDDEYQEGLVCDTDGHIIEATSSNVFFEVGGGLVTPDLQKCGVAGVLRSEVIDYCNSHGIKLSVRDFGLDEVADIEAMFLCNSIIGIWPVRHFNELAVARTATVDELIAVFTT